MIWKIISAIKFAVQRLRFPLVKIHGSNWDEHDHCHVCIAARLLDAEDFVKVCPFGGKCNIEWDDCCDRCEYKKLLMFRSKGEVKWILLV